MTRKRKIVELEISNNKTVETENSKIINELLTKHNVFSIYQPTYVDNNLPTVTFTYNSTKIN